MKDYGYRKALSKLSSQELKAIIEKRSSQHNKKSLLDAQNILFERAVDFVPVYPDEINLPDSVERLSIEDNSLWEKVIEMKNSGLSLEVIRLQLNQKGIDPGEIELTFKRVPKNFISEEFEESLRKQYSTGIKGQIIILALLTILFAYFLNLGSFKKENMWLAAIVIIFPIFASLIINIGKKNRAQFWINLINSSPEKIIWINPVKTKVKAAGVITLLEARHFELYTDTGEKFDYIANSDNEFNEFLNFIKQSLPHAHIGYSKEISDLYFKNGNNNFLENLSQNGLYTPIDKIRV